MNYNPLDWFWVVAGDETRAWSSAACAYVTEWPSDRVTHIASEAELIDVLKKVYPSGAPLDGDAVDAERDRRIHSGFTFNGVRFQSRLEDQKRIAGAGTLAAVAIMNGAQPEDFRWHGGDTDFVWIAEDNSLVPMDAQTVIAFGQAAARHETLHVFAARALKDADPIPSNYIDDIHWPSAT